MPPSTGHFAKGLVIAKAAGTVSGTPGHSLGSWVTDEGFGQSWTL